MTGRQLTEPLVIAIDCSTTAAKVIVVDRSGTTVAAGRRPLDLSRPCPGWHEQDADQWWSATLGAVTDAVAATGDPARIAAICVTHQRETFVCLDDEGRPLRPAILWLDSRASSEIADYGSSGVHEVSGKPPDVTPSLYKLAWLRRHEPEVLATAAKVGDVQAYLCWKLTGVWATGDGSADALGLFDIQRRHWSPELLEIAGLRAAQLPTIFPAGARIAGLDEQVAHAIGLPAGTAVVAGIGDGQAAGLGADVTSPGAAYLNLGTSMVLGIQADSYHVDPAFRTLTGSLSSDFDLETIMNAATYLANWFREEFGDPALAGRPDPALDAAAAAVPIGADGLLTLPYWNAAQTPYWDPLARGAVVGWHGRHTRAHLYRSLLESVGYELRLHIAGLEAATGRRIETLRAMGGGSRSELWLRLLADITQRSIQVCADTEISAKGAAVLGFSYLDGGGDAAIRTAARSMVSYDQQVAPDPSTAAAYTRYFEIYRELYPRLRSTFAALATVED